MMFGWIASNSSIISSRTSAIRLFWPCHHSISTFLPDSPEGEEPLPPPPLLLPPPPPELDPPPPQALNSAAGPAAASAAIRISLLLLATLAALHHRLIHRA